MTSTEMAGLMPAPATPAKPATRRRSLSSFFGRGRILFYQVALIGGFLLLWEAAVQFGWIKVYLYGQPTGVCKRDEMVGGGIEDHASIVKPGPAKIIQPDG